MRSGKSGNLLLCLALGVWLMCTRLIFGTEGAMANSDHITGALVITVTATALAEIARPVRFINVLFGIWLIIAPFLLDGATPLAAAGSIIVGIALIVLSLPRGPVRQRYGGLERYIF